MPGLSFLAYCPLKSEILQTSSIVHGNADDLKTKANLTLLVFEGRWKSARLNLATIIKLSVFSLMLHAHSEQLILTAITQPMPDYTGLGRTDQENSSPELPKTATQT